ncbi:hypothetical protein OB955_21390 [Halobacteria archaeon AArc-m2/3/4]|uniref:Hsp20/alpha crystallin family protein n=1 Tax=Natronoglomus mannanivorans TaxID=2979990 RepID=A0ABT2QK53_9EURY|nr:hypothetical protein [Halobacteria archaeon AArc-m2/3/4]
MRVPQSLKDVDEHRAIVRTYEDDGGAIVVDFGPASSELAVDIVGDTVIVTDDEQVEFELPTGASDVTVNNGVLTITE